MIVLDTNVISEILKRDISEEVAEWVRTYPRTQLFTTAITEAEILYGIAILPRGRRRNDLATAVKEMFQDAFMDRVLSFDSKAAHAYSEISALRRSQGRPMSHADAQICAIALVNRATVATRDTSDFEGCGVNTVNPWESA